MDTSSDSSQKKLPFEKPWVLLLLTFALLARVYASLYHTDNLDPDVAVNSLMVRHVAEGRHFPTMYYNESYVGTLEVYVGALFQRLLPIPVTPSLLGFALVSFVALPFFYLWARKTAGPLSALAGLALMVVGPLEFFYRNVFIGYPTALLCGMAACWLTLRLRESAVRGPPPARELFSLGLVAGIGWWTQAIVLAYLLPCAVVLLCSVSWRHWIRSGLFALPGLLLGSLPWLVFTFREAGALQFVTNVSASGGGNFSRNILTALEMAASMYHPPAPAFSSLGWAALPALGLLLLGGLVVAIKTPEERLARLMPWLLMFSTLFLCGISNRFAHVPATRYLLPVVPAVALIAGQGVAWLATRLPRALKPLGFLCLSLVLLAEILRLPNAWDPEHKAYRDYRLRQLDELITLSESESIDILYGNFFKNWITSVSNERLRVSTFPDRFDRYRPYRGEASLSPKIGVLDNHQGLGLFLEQTGGAAEVANVRGIPIQWNLRNESSPGEWLPLEEIESAVWEDGAPARDLFDGNLDTPLSAGHLDRERVKTRERTLRIFFHEPRRITGIHAWGPSGSWGRVTRLVAIREGEKITLLESGRRAGWFWSGDSPHLFGFLAHYQASFPEVTTRELHITLVASENDGMSHVSELRLLTPAQNALPAPSQQDPVTVFAGKLRQDPPSKVYAPRWIAERLRVKLPDVPNVLPDDLYEQYEGRDRYPAHPLARMVTLDGAALIVPAMASASTRRHLQQRGWNTRIEAEAGKLILMRVDPKIPGKGSTWLHWTEQGAFLATEWFSDPLSLDDFVPLLSESVSYPRGITLESLAIERVENNPGSSVRMVYGWKCPKEMHPNQWAVFVHVRKEGQTVFQDDHVWMSGTPSEALAMQPEGWTFEVSRELEIPKNLPPGSYDISLGLYDRNSGDRLRPRKSEQVQRRAIILENAIRIEVAE